MSGARGLVAALVGVAIGGTLILLASGRVWSTAAVHVPGASVADVSVTGHAVEPSLPALGVALLALAVAVIAASGAVRRLVGALVALVGGIAMGAAIAGRGAVSSALTDHEIGDAGIPVHGSANGWWLVAMLGGLIAVLVGLAVALRSRQLAEMGPKYEAPQPRSAQAVAAEPVDTAASPDAQSAASSDAQSAASPDARSAASPDAQSAWEALDRGEDPTT
jgi:uncharacterized membrane protein (TIGR02234 family)